MQAIYIVYEPKKNGKSSIAAITESLEDAKKSATALKDKFTKKGWDSWANRVEIKKPTNPKVAQELANELVRKGNTLDMMNQGGTFRRSSYDAIGSMDLLYHWASLLRKAASN